MNTPSGKSAAVGELMMTEIVFPSQVNPHGTLFGGIALQWMDQAAWLCATRSARKTFVTIASERVEFKKPVYGGDIVVLRTAVVRVGRTSMTVRVDLHAENPLSGEEHLATTGEFVLVALDADGRPTPVQ